MVDGRALLVRPFDPGDIHLIERAIGESGLGLTTQAAKTVIRVPVPQLSQDRREELAAAAGRLAEEARVAVRNVRRDALRDAAAIKAVDDRRRHEESVGDLVRRYLGLVDEELAVKIHNVLGEEDRWRPTERKGKRKQKEKLDDRDGTTHGEAC